MPHQRGDRDEGPPPDALIGTAGARSADGLAAGYTASGIKDGVASTGVGNTGTGTGALSRNSSGQNNTAIGGVALKDNTTGEFNTALFGALNGSTTGNHNTAVGNRAGYGVQQGSLHVLLGSNAEPSSSSATNEIVIGAGATGQGNNYAVIGNADVERVYIAQDGAGVLYANGTIVSSNRRIKKHITDLGIGLDYVRRLRPVRYLKKHPSEYPQALQDKFYPNGHIRQVDAAEYDTPQVGFIAQEVQAVNEHFGIENNIVAIDEDGFHRMDYEKLVVPVVRGVQELDVVVQELKATVQQRDAVIATQQAQLETVLARLAALERQLTE